MVIRCNLIADLDWINVEVAVTILRSAGAVLVERPPVSLSPASPSPSTSTDPAHAVLHGFWAGITQLATTDPWVPVLVALVVITALVRSARVAIHDGPRDTVRLFTSRDKTTLLAYAGHRCEQHGWLTGRCANTDKLEADHVHPHSRGGSTHVSNGQILCQSHNRTKSAAIPWNRSLRKIAERRAAYYPTGVNRSVSRRRRGDVTPAVTR